MLPIQNTSFATKCQVSQTLMCQRVSKKGQPSNSPASCPNSILKKREQMALSHRARLGLEAKEGFQHFPLSLGRETASDVRWWMSEPHEDSKKEGFSQEHLPQRKVQSFCEVILCWLWPNFCGNCVILTKMLIISHMTHTHTYNFNVNCMLCWIIYQSSKYLPLNFVNTSRYFTATSKGDL